MSELEEVKILIGIPLDETEEDSLIELLIERATTILNNSTAHPKDYAYLIVDAAIYGYNLRGAEGNKSESSGGFNTSWFYDSMRSYIAGNLPAPFVIK